MRVKQALERSNPKLGQNDHDAVFQFYVLYVLQVSLPLTGL